MFTLDILYSNVNKYKVDRMETHCIQHFNNTSNTHCSNFKGNPLIKYKKYWYMKRNKIIWHMHVWHASQIYKFHGFIPNLCKIYYFICSYCLNTNGAHYLKSCARLLCVNNMNRHTTFVSILYEPMRNKFRTIIIAKLWPMKFVK
jgi:hypothetical protein